MHYQSNNFLNYIHASKLLSNGRQFYSSRILLIKGRALVLNGLIIKAMKRIIHVAWKDTSIDYLIWHVLKLFLLQIKRNSQLHNLVGRSTVARLARGNHRPRDKLVNTAPPCPLDSHIDGHTKIYYLIAINEGITSEILARNRRRISFWALGPQVFCPPPLPSCRGLGQMCVHLEIYL
jgi:hypothetical protein